MSDTSPERSPAGPGGTEPGDVVRGGAAERDDLQAAASEAPESLVGSTLAERYRVEKLLGSGGMGAVYRAEHVHMKKSVAVKVLHREMTYLPEVVARFEREAVAAARIEHPHVAAATDFGRLADGAFYLVLEYVEGHSLRELIKRHGRLAPSLALHITRQIAEALSAAHAADIVHRDLKPDNVMLIERDGDPHFVKVLDFGIAKVNTGEAGQQLTQLGSVFGTPEYMSPEQAAGTPVDARSDLYTLGILLYEMLSGATPFDDDDLVVVLTRQMTMDPPPLPAGVPPQVVQFALHLLAKDPDARPQTAGDVVAAIDQLLGSPVDALIDASPPPSSVLSPTPSPMSIDDAGVYGETVLSLQRPPSLSAADASGPSRAVSVVQPKSGISGLFGPLFARVPALAKKVDVGGQPVPVWLFAAMGLVAVVAAFFVLTAGLVASAGSGKAAAGGGATVEEPDVDTEALLRRAAEGDRTALAELAARPEADRTAREWHSLGRGYHKIRNVRSGLLAYEKALALDPALGKDPTLQKDVLHAARDRSTAASAMDLAVSSLGSAGPDLIYEVWDGSRGKNGDAQINKLAKARLDGEALRANASPALLVALDLASARGCAAMKPVVERAAQSADERSLSKLKSLSARRGCGFLGMSDCYSCLRRGSSLSDAVSKAQSTPAPKFE